MEQRDGDEPPLSDGCTESGAEASSPQDSKSSDHEQGWTFKRPAVVPCPQTNALPPAPPGMRLGSRSVGGPLSSLASLLFPLHIPALHPPHETYGGSKARGGCFAVHWHVLGHSVSWGGKARRAFPADTWGTLWVGRGGLRGYSSAWQGAAHVGTGQAAYPLLSIGCPST